MIFLPTVASKVNNELLVSTKDDVKKAEGSRKPLVSIIPIIFLNVYSAERNLNLAYPYPSTHPLTLKQGGAGAKWECLPNEGSERHPGALLHML